MQHKIKKPSRLLNQHGELIQKGYATSPILRYNRKNVAWKLRLKEWDYYLISNEKYAVAITVGKSTAILFIGASFIDLEHKEETTKSVVRIVSDCCFTMPESSESGDIIYQDAKVNLSIKHDKDKRDLYLSIKDFLKGEKSDTNLFTKLGLNQTTGHASESTAFEVSFTLSHEPGDSMVIATPFKQSRKEFYYNQKIIGMYAMGKVCLGDQTFTFVPYQSFALLDWGRGVWPYKTTWYWSACQGMIYGDLFGFNLGYGFGDTSAATENMLFYNGVASKLENVIFHIPQNERNEYEYMKTWFITSSDHRVKLKFTPVYDRSANLSVILLSTNQHQVFGTFSGTAVLDDGKIIFLKDFPGFAERVENRW